MGKLKLDLNALSVTRFEPVAPGETGADFETQDLSCIQYCGPDDKDTGPGASGMWWC